MKTVILAGGLGTRLAEETVTRPKPMVEIGGKPMLWHIMNIFAAHGFCEFVLALGYRSEVVKEYFLNFYAHDNDLTIDLASGTSRVHEGRQPQWRVHCVDTGPVTQTGGRIKRLASWLDGERFFATYGDGVANVDVGRLLEFHRSHGRLATVTAVHPPSRFGALSIDGDTVRSFDEKPQTGEGWINGGFFVFEPEVLDYIDGDGMPLEHIPLQRLAADDQLRAFRHDGFWQPMDTLRERQLLETLWAGGSAPWKVW